MIDADMKVSPAMLEFLRWVGARQRSYAETMEAWRTSCPRSSVWEDASIHGYVFLVQDADELGVSLTPIGRAIVGDA